MTPERELTEARNRIAALEQELRASRGRVERSEMMEMEEETRHVSRVRMPRPGTFDGKDPQGLENWIDAVEHYLQGENVEERRWVTFGVGFLEGNAREWWRFAKNTVEAGKTVTWDMFTSGLRSQFVPAVAEEMARSKLLKLRQTTDVASYAAEIRALALKARVQDPKLLLQLFIDGLKTRTRFEVAQRSPGSLEEAISHGLRCDALAYGTSRPTQFVPLPAPATDTGMTPMELDAIRARGTLTAEERTTLMRRGACFYCREVGHLRMHCPKRPGNGGGRQE
jgi:hypothetical protein